MTGREASRPIGWQDWDPCEHPPGAAVCGWCLPAPDAGRMTSPCALDGCEAAPCARGMHPTACVNTAGREATP